MKNSVMITVFYLLITGIAFGESGGIDASPTLYTEAHVAQRTAQMHQLEQEPYVGGIRQLMKIGKDMYFRNYGELKFQKMVYDEENNRYMPVDKEAASQAGALFEKANPTAALEVNGTIFTDGFEGGVPGDVWSSSDFYGGNISWGHVNCRKDGGDYSAWCSVGPGVDDCSSYWGMGIYPMMSLQDNIYIGAYEYLTVQFRTWYELALGEEEFDDDDYFDVFAIIDGGDYWLGTMTGSAKYWHTKSYDINLDGTEYYFNVSFDFFPNGNSLDEEGIYVDNFVLSGIPKSIPNLAPVTPSGWSSSIVINYEDGSYTDPLQYIPNEPAYVNFAFTNIGGYESGYFYIMLRIDGQDVTQIPWMESLDPYEIGSVYQSDTYSFAPGQHTVTVILDYYDDVDEPDDLNNMYSRTFTVLDIRPDLAFATPPGWDAPVLLTQTPYSRVDDDDFPVSGTAYLHWAVKNIGDISTSQQYVTTVYLDGSPFYSTLTEGLDVGDWDLHEEIPIEGLSYGTHTIEVKIDEAGEVNESNILNNNATKTALWEEDEIRIQGKFEYIVPWIPNVPQYKIPAGFRVRIYDYDVATETLGTLIDEMYTTVGGSFSSPYYTNRDDDGTHLDIVVELATIKEDQVIRVYDWTTATYDNENVFALRFGPYIDVDDITFILPGEMPGFPTLINLFESNFFNAADVFDRNYKKWMEYRPQDDLGEHIDVKFITDCDAVGYLSDVDQLWVGHCYTPFSSNAYAFNNVKLSELFIERTTQILGFFTTQTTGAVNPSIWLGPQPNSDIASKHGLSSFWAAIVELNSNVYRYVYNAMADTMTLDLETGVFLNVEESPEQQGTVNAMGRFNQGACASIFWDMIDTDEDDLSGPVDWGILDLPHHPDAVGDVMSVSVEEILSVLIDKKKDVAGWSPPQSILDFYQHWIAEPSNGDEQRFRDILYEHGIDLSGCYMPGDVNDDQLVNLLDLNYLIAHIYQNAAQPVFIAHGDVNNDCTINLLDLTYLIAYIYQGGPAPTCGCATLKPYQQNGDDDPNSQTTVAELLVSMSGSNSIIDVVSDLPLLAVELDIVCSETSQIVNLTQNAEAISASGTTHRTVGVLNRSGEILYESGRQPIVEITGEAEILSARAVTSDGRLISLAIADSEKPGNLPMMMSLAQNYPNPFNPTTAIEFSLPTESNVSIVVYNIVGQEVVTLTDKVYEAGVHQVVWDGRDGAGESVASGTYLYRLNTDNGTLTRKMVLLK